MADSIEQIGSSIDALMREFYIITNNLANVSTAGYKRRCNAFSKVLEAQQSGSQTYSSGTINLNSVLDFSQGSFTETGRSLDLALHGKGFFVIETPQGPLYTRNGVFNVNPNGQIVTSDGHIVAGEAGVITLPPAVGLSQVNVAADGSVSAAGTIVGKFRLVDFRENEGKLVPAGANSFKMPDPDARPVSAENVVAKQGYQEASNVRIVDELVDMIMVSRLYEANMKLVAAKKEASNSLMSAAMG